MSLPAAQSQRTIRRVAEGRGGGGGKFSDINSCQQFGIVRSAFVVGRHILKAFKGDANGLTSEAALT